MEGLVNLLAVVNNLLFGFGEGVSHKVVWLHGADREVYVALSDLKWIEGHILGLISQAVLQFTYTGKNSRTIGLQLTIFSAHSKLYGEPVNGGKARKFALIRAKTCETYLLAEICEVLVCEHGGMAEELVDDVGLRGVERHAVVADVLGRVEHLKGETVQELALS